MRREREKADEAKTVTHLPLIYGVSTLRNRRVLVPRRSLKLKLNLEAKATHTSPKMQSNATQSKKSPLRREPHNIAKAPLQHLFEI